MITIDVDTHFSCRHQHTVLVTGTVQQIQYFTLILTSSHGDCTTLQSCQFYNIRWVTTA